MEETTSPQHNQIREIAKLQESLLSFEENTILILAQDVIESPLANSLDGIKLIAQILFTVAHVRPKMIEKLALLTRSIDYFFVYFDEEISNLKKGYYFKSCLLDMIVKAKLSNAQYFFVRHLMNLKIISIDEVVENIKNEYYIINHRSEEEDDNNYDESGYSKINSEMNFWLFDYFDENYQEFNVNFRLKIFGDIPDFKRKADLGYNEDNVADIIRKDDIQSLIDLKLNYPNFSFNSSVKQSIYERCDVLRNDEVKLIYYAAFFGSIKIFKYLLLNFDLSKRSQKIIDYAVFGGNIECIRILEQYKYNFKMAISNSIEYFMNDVFIWLYEIANLDSASIKQNSFIESSIKTKNINIFLYLIEEAKIDLNSQDHAKRTFLHYSIIHNVPCIAKFLLSKKNINYMIDDQYDHNPFYYAIGKNKIFNMFIQRSDFEKNIKITKDIIEAAIKSPNNEYLGKIVNIPINNWNFTRTDFNLYNLKENMSLEKLRYLLNCRFFKEQVFNSLISDFLIEKKYEKALFIMGKFIENKKKLTQSYSVETLGVKVSDLTGILIENKIPYSLKYNKNNGFELLIGRESSSMFQFFYKTPARFFDVFALPPPKLYPYPISPSFHNKKRTVHINLYI